MPSNDLVQEPNGKGGEAAGAENNEKNMQHSQYSCIYPQTIDYHLQLDHTDTAIIPPTAKNSLFIRYTPLCHGLNPLPLNITIHTPIPLDTLVHPYKPYITTFSSLIRIQPSYPQLPKIPYS